MTSHSPELIWIIIVTAAIGTWLLRVSFMAAMGTTASVPPLVTRILRLIPAAVLAALVAPALTHADGSLDLANTRLVAGIVAGVVAWRTKHVLATIGAGMGVLWLLEWLV